jgi:hypothetical protein
MLVLLFAFIYIHICWVERRFRRIEISIRNIEVVTNRLAKAVNTLEHIDRCLPQILAQQAEIIQPQDTSPDSTPGSSDIAPTALRPDPSP